MRDWLLLVEDDKDIQESMRDLLELEGYTVISAFDGEEALTQLRISPHRPHMVLLDLMMPGMNGIQFREIQLADPEIADIPVVIMSAAGQEDRLRQTTADGYITKPADVEVILGVVRRFIGTHDNKLPKKVNR